MNFVSNDMTFVSHLSFMLFVMLNRPDSFSDVITCVGLIYVCLQKQFRVQLYMFVKYIGLVGEATGLASLSHLRPPAIYSLFDEMAVVVNVPGLYRGVIIGKLPKY